MAERGGQPGNRNAVKNRPFADAIQRALAWAEANGDFCTLTRWVESLNEEQALRMAEAFIESSRRAAARAGDNPNLVEEVVRMVIKAINRPQGHL